MERKRKLIKCGVKGRKEETYLFSDLFPDDSGHLVAIQLHNGVLHDDFFRHASICDSEEEVKRQRAAVACGCVDTEKEGRRDKEVKWWDNGVPPLRRRVTRVGQTHSHRLAEEEKPRTPWFE